MKKRFNSALLLACASILIIANDANATTVTQLTSPNQISPNATVLNITGTLGTASPGSALAFNNGDNYVIFTRASGNFEVDQAGVNYGATSFANNTRLVGAGGFQGPGDGGPISISFIVPVTQFELNAEEFQPGSYYFLFTAYDKAGTSLGGYFGGGSGNALSFAGLSVSGDAISSVTFDDGPTNGGGGTNNLLFGNLKYLNYNVAAQAPPPEIPEPATFAQLGIGLLTLAFMSRRFVSHRQDSISTSSKR